MNSRPTALRRSARGVAIVIVLAVIVLLAGMVMAFFSRVSNERTVANSDAGAAKADLLARSALGIIVSDLKQEIVVTSTATTITTGTASTTIYYPKTALSMMPARTGTDMGVPNLIRQSLRNDGLSVSSSASAVNSATDVSANGRSVSPARWNAHYLIPRQNSTSTTIDSTPVSTYSAPDWVFVNRSGRVAINAPASTLADASPANGNFVVGRYAFAIYDEGGLLDINIAGAPSSGSTAEIARKGSAALADLTQLPTETGTLSQSQVDQLIGWRNYATAQPSGDYPSFTFDATAASRYLGYVTGNTNGFLTTSGSTYNNRPDQAVLTRQQLIQISRSLGLGQNVLQYLGTFSRDIEQPSFVPDPNRPKVQAAWSNTTSKIFGTGNDAYTSTASTDAASDINPPLLNVRVQTAFTRPDGTAAQKGDALLAKRFPLSRLSLITKDSTATQSQNDAIYRNFGLYRSSANDVWKYDHGKGSGICRLSAVASQSREPDFFEILKAAINVGSLAKGAAWNFATNKTTNAFYFQQARDTLTDLQILQIGANIIDQTQADNFPTRIQFAGDTTNPPNIVRGVVDLPYLYAVRDWFMRVKDNSGDLLGAYFLQPQLWNPHSKASSSTVSQTNTPSSFRFRITQDPSVSGTTISIAADATYTGNYVVSGSTKSISSAPDLSNLFTLNNDATPPALLFKGGELNGGWGFREPTLLAISGRPATANMASTDYTDTYSGENMTGVLMATFPWLTPLTDGTTTITGTVQKIHIYANSDIPSMRFYLDYQDSSGNWIPYDEQVFQYQASISSQDLHMIRTYTTYSAITQNMDWWGGIRTDPRTSRWSLHFTEYFCKMPIADLANNVRSSMRPDGGIGYGSHFGSVNDLGFVNPWATYAKEQRGFQVGYWAENSTRATYQTDGSSLYRYNRDADGIARRAMAGYVTDTANGGTAAQATQPATGLPLYADNDTSRPTILHRPFRSVAELGYVFRDTPWGNINFSFPESGDSALLDVFCINENAHTAGLVAGRVNLNTQQAPVLQALIAKSLRDKDDTSLPLLTGSMAANLATKLVARSSTLPLRNRAHLVGAWNYSGDPSTSLQSTPDPDVYYSGFSYDIGTVSGVSGTPIALIPRQRESVIRALADAGNTRTWNLLIDVVAQSGRFPPGASSLARFNVDGEKRFWLHVAIDRYTGTVLDSQLEVVK